MDYSLRHLFSLIVFSYLLSQNPVYAQACQSGTNATGCTIGTSDTSYNLTGNIAVTGTTYIDDLTWDNSTDDTAGIKFTSGADGNVTELTGDIATMGYRSFGLRLESSDSNTVSLTGDILTGDGVSHAINLESSDSNTINMTGDISTIGLSSDGIRLDESDSNTINMTGDISTLSHSQSIGIYLYQSEFNTTNLTGNISTTAPDGLGSHSWGLAILRKPGISTGGGNNITNIIGNISTDVGWQGWGIAVQTDYNITNLTGNISTIGDSGYGLFATGNHNQTNITGNISTKEGSGAFGVYDVGSNNTTNIIGNISTTGPGGYAIAVSSDESNKVNLTGDITTSGFGGHGVWVTGGGSHTVNLNGNISTTGVGGYGIFFGSTDANTINLNGNISTTEVGGRGYELAISDSNTISMTGDITTTGDNADGIYFWDSTDSNTINMTGKVSATGSGAYAVKLDGTSNNNTFNFNQGSTIIGGLSNAGTNNTFKFKQGVSIIGDIENNGDMTNKLIFDMGKAASYNFDFGSTTWTVEDSHKSVVNGSAKSMGVADIDNQAHTLYRRTSSINDALSERQRVYQEGQRPKGYYFDSYSVHDKREKDQSQISGNAGGMTVGYALENSDRPMEVFVNYEVSRDKYGLDSEQTTESESLLAGLFLPSLFKGVLEGDISAKFLIGASVNKAERKVLNNKLNAGASSENISGNYRSSFVSIGAEWLSEISKTENTTHDISIGGDLVNAYNENYTAGEYTVDSRDMTQLQSKFLYGVTYKNSEKSVDVNARFGIAYQQLLSGKKQDYKINGTSVSFTGDDNSLYYTAGLGAKYYLKDNMNLYVDTKLYQSNDDKQHFTVGVGLISRF